MCREGPAVGVDTSNQWIHEWKTVSGPNWGKERDYQTCLIREVVIVRRTWDQEGKILGLD